jgi:hypothetical protein
LRTTPPPFGGLQLFSGLQLFGGRALANAYLGFKTRPNFKEGATLPYEITHQKSMVWAKWLKNKEKMGVEILYTP